MGFWGFGVLGFWGFVASGVILLIVDVESVFVDDFSVLVILSIVVKEPKS